MMMVFPREKNVEREKKVAQDGALREGRQEKNFRKVGRVPGECSEVGRDEAGATGFGLMIGMGIVGGFRECYFCGVMEKVRWQWSDD